ncbi:hypothetical protein ACFY2H_41990 [Streptomyces griseofuscus]|uniref:hypothetical protein n=1 Tax=Streptomyces griseofuscus TaxID=146922 RepID=UPI0036B7DD00
MIKLLRVPSVEVPPRARGRQARNAVVRDPASAARALVTAGAEEGRAAHSGLLLPDYGAAG